MLGNIKKITCNLQSKIGLFISENVATPVSGVLISNNFTDPSPNPGRIINKRHEYMSSKYPTNILYL